MKQKIKDNIWKFSFSQFGSNVYFLDLEKKIIIDTSSESNKEELLNHLKELNIKEIDFVLLTHGHYDHVENTDVFLKNNVKVYASEEDIKTFELKNIEPIKNISKELKNLGIKILKTPGHSKGSLCFLYKDILFSGDTVFKDGYGRTDLATGSNEDLEKSLNKIKEIKYNILCPGH